MILNNRVTNTSRQNDGFGSNIALTFGHYTYGTQVPFWLTENPLWRREKSFITQSLMYVIALCAICNNKSVIGSSGRVVKFSKCLFPPVTCGDISFQSIYNDYRISSRHVIPQREFMKSSEYEEGSSFFFFFITTLFPVVYLLR